jgi:hypothetical protein
MTKMDSLGMGLGAARDELATLQLTNCIRCPKPWSDNDSEWQAPSQGLLRCGILMRLLTGSGQNRQLPHCNMAVCFTSINRHNR